jgi:hypothetical protein
MMKPVDNQARVKDTARASVIAKLPVFCVC